MKLKYLNINGHGVLVDESTEILPCKPSNVCLAHKTKPCDKCNRYQGFKIIFAEKELNLNVPILPDWKEWEVEQLALQ